MNHQCARTCGKCEPEDGEIEESKEVVDPDPEPEPDPDFSEEPGEERRIVRPPKERPKSKKLKRIGHNQKVVFAFLNEKIN